MDDEDSNTINAQHQDHHVVTTDRIDWFLSETARCSCATGGKV
jgi:hypothetical protein